MFESSYLIVALILGFGCFVQSLIGFGLAIVAAPIMLQVKPELVPATVSLVAFLLSTITTWQYRKGLSLKGLGYAFVGRIPGTALAAIAMIYISATTFAIVMGLAVLSAVVVSLVKIDLQPNNRNMFIAGFLSGLIGTTTSIGGPPMALIMQNSEATNLRANLSLFFWFSSLLSLVALYMTGHFTEIHLKAAAMALPTMLIGNLIAYRIAPYIDKKWIRYGLLVLCSVAGGMSLAQGLGW
ncbi:sulfite exporter TauE/SafE family protein [Parasalinivibrio latis]|uniref:sulfite exporter TauE/SafE family protein n=1 Tax=Parasalinivibrio latis TaxID=2952610 RepID=UPI0030DF1F12